MKIETQQKGMKSKGAYRRALKEGKRRALAQYPDEHEAFHNEYAASFAIAVVDERERHRAVLRSPLAQGRQEFALELLAHDLDADEILAVLENQPHRWNLANSPFH